jgi:type IX secretion system PorP/SprF family membrane protein
VFNSTVHSSMKPILLKYVVVFAMLSIAVKASGQDIHFSQIFETPFLRNPALAGLFNGDIRVQTVYRSQWNQVTDAYHTGSANMEYKLPVGNGDDFLTVGGQILYDKSGTVNFSSTHILPAINFHKSLSTDKNKYLSLAFMGGVIQKRIDQDKITTNNQYFNSTFNPDANNGEPLPSSSYTYFDGSVGLSYNSQIGENVDNNFYLGIAYHHFAKSKKIGFYSNESSEFAPKLVGSAGIRMSLTDYSFVTFEGDYSKQGTTTEIIGGLLYSLKLDEIENPIYIIHAGTYVRMNDAIIPVIKLETTPMSYAVSYDINISGLKKVSTGRGGFELSISYKRFLDRDNSSSKALKCPKF